MTLAGKIHRFLTKKLSLSHYKIWNSKHIHMEEMSTYLHIVYNCVYLSSETLFQINQFYLKAKEALTLYKRPNKKIGCKFNPIRGTGVVFTLSLSLLRTDWSIKQLSEKTKQTNKTTKAGTMEDGQKQKLMQSVRQEEGLTQGMG